MGKRDELGSTLATVGMPGFVFDAPAKMGSESIRPLSGVSSGVMLLSLFSRPSPEAVGSRLSRTEGSMRFLPTFRPREGIYVRIPYSPRR